MAEETRDDITIVGNEANWELRSHGAINGTYFGTFKFRCFLTPLQKIAANREMRQLLGEQMLMAPEHEANLAYAITQLKHRVISAPPFWNSSVVAGDIPDENIIMAVLDAAIACELKYLRQINERKVDALNRAKAAAEAMLGNVGKDEEFDDEDTSQEGSD